jgi:hypothetical protein
VLQVRRIVFDASYLVLGLGDVYLGAPCAVPVNPMHRVVTAKMNPARTFTHEGTVGEWQLAQALQFRGSGFYAAGNLQMGFAGLAETAFITPLRRPRSFSTDGVLALAL